MSEQPLPTNQPTNQLSGQPTNHLSIRAGTWSLIRFRPGFYLVNMIFASIWIVTRLVPGWLEKLFYDRLTGSSASAASLWSILGIIVAVEMARLASDVTGEWGGMQVRNAAGALMRTNILRAILRKPGAVPLPVPSGDVINRLDDDIADFADFPTWTPEVFGHFLFTVIALVIMARISPLITAVTMVPLAGVFLLNRWAWAHFLSHGHKSRAANSKVSGFLGEIFGSVQAVKVSGAEQGTMSYFRVLNERRRRLNVRYATYLALFHAATDHLGDIAIAVMVLLAGSAFASGNFTIGDFALFSSYLFFAARFPATIGSFISEIAQQRVVLDRVKTIIPDAAAADLVQHNDIYEFSHREDATAAQRPPVPHVVRSAVHRLENLEVNGLSYRYARSQSSVNGNQEVNTGDRSLTPDSGGIFDIDFTLDRGSFTVITGRIGSGKTTLLRVLLGLLPHDEGEIRWNGRLLPDPATFLVPPRSAYTPQVPRLFSAPLQDNILFGLPSNQVDLPAAIWRAVMEPDIATLEKGLETVVGPRGVRLSGGQVQRSAAARMFVRDTELLVFDDLSSALDVETERFLWQRLLDQESTTAETEIAHSGRQAHTPTCLVVSHRRAAFRRADQIIVLENGRLAAKGSLDTLVNSSPIFQSLWYGTAQQNAVTDHDIPSDAPFPVNGKKEVSDDEN